MATYIMTFKFTQRGLENVKESPARVEAAKRLIQSMGGEVKAFYAVLGANHDTMFIVEAPGEDAVTKMAMGISALGNVRSSTHRAFTEGEFAKLASDLP